MFKLTELCFALQYASCFSQASVEDCSNCHYFMQYPYLFVSLSSQKTPCVFSVPNAVFMENILRLAWLHPCFQAREEVILCQLGFPFDQLTAKLHKSKLLFFFYWCNLLFMLSCLLPDNKICTGQTQSKKESAQEGSA